MQELYTYGLQGTQLSGRHNLALLKESLLSILEFMEDTSIFPCLTEKRLNYGHSTPKVTSPILYLHSSARTQGWPAEASEGVRQPRLLESASTHISQCSPAISRLLWRMRTWAEKAGTPPLLSCCTKTTLCKTKISSFSQTELNKNRKSVFTKSEN